MSQRAGLLRISGRRALFWAWAVMLVPMHVAVSLVAPQWASVATWLGIVVFFVMGVVVMQSRCPRCDGFFHSGHFPNRRFKASSLFTSSCLSCGLRLEERGRP
jgi:hypothetical protein